MSTRQLERLFRRYLNRSPKRYYMELRLQKARNLLMQTDMSVINVALACGFASPSHFSKCYRVAVQHHALPRTWRPGRARDGDVTTLRTNRLTLRPARPDDLEAFLDIFSNEEAMRYWDGLPHRDADFTRNLLAGMTARNAAGGGDFVVERAGEVIGKAGAWHDWNVGYIFRPDQWGQGIASEAVGACRRSHLRPRHHGSPDRQDRCPQRSLGIRVLEKLGFFEHRDRAEKALQVGDEMGRSASISAARRR